jgi:hypothetical protein
VRLLDTRPDGNTADCKAARIGFVGAGSFVALVVAGRAAPTDAIAVSLNVTVTDARADGFITVFPCGTDRVDGSNVNYTKGSTVANAVIAKLGTKGTVCLFTYAPVHLVVDADGWVPATSDYVPTAPNRLLDTRQLDTPARPDGGLVPAGTTVSLTIGGRTGVPADASAVVVNITAADTRGPGVVSIVPCDQPTINASTLNFIAGQNVPNLTIAALDTTGRLCVRTTAATHLLVDLNGWFPHTTTYHPVTPARLLDTRPGLGTVDGAASGTGPSAAGQITQLRVTGRAGIPATATTVVLNITVDGARAPGFVTVFPCGTTPPNASTLNYDTGQTIANATLAHAGLDGTICLFTYATTDLVVDVNGYAT